MILSPGLALHMGKGPLAGGPVLSRASHLRLAENEDNAGRGEGFLRPCKLQEAAAASRLLRQVRLSLPGTQWLFWPPQEASHWVCLLELCRGSIGQEEAGLGLVAWVTEWGRGEDEPSGP